MFGRKEPQQPETGGMPIEPISIFGPDLLAKLTSHLTAQGTERLAKEFADDTIKRWINQQTTETLTQEEKDRVSSPHFTHLNLVAQSPTSNSGTMFRS